MRTLYISRHGQRLDSVDRHWYKPDGDKNDTPLSERGFEQARLLGERLKDEPIDYIFASPFIRALQTAQGIAEARDQSFYVETGLGEWLSRGLVTEKPALPTLEARAQDFSYLDLGYSPVIETSYPESGEQVMQRLDETLNHLLSAFEGNILLVAHGKVVTGVGHLMTRKPETTMKYPVACLTQLTQTDDDKWALTLNGDTAHLENKPVIV